MFFYPVLSTSDFSINFQVLEEFGELQTVLNKSVEVYDSELEDELAELLAESPKSEELPDTAEGSPKKPGKSRGSLENEKVPNIAKEFSSLRLKGNSSLG